MKLHALIIAYASDSAFINTAARANGFSYNSQSIGMMASLDHSMWFHKPARADEWLLYDMHSPRTNNGRGVAFGRIYTRDGILIATTAQEGVIRLSELEIKRREKQARDEKALNHHQSSSSNSRL
jgi:acyl-CoA thioesterase II